MTLSFPLSSMPGLTKLLESALARCCKKPWSPCERRPYLPPPQQAARPLGKERQVGLVLPYPDRLPARRIRQRDRQRIRPAHPAPRCQRKGVLHLQAATPPSPSASHTAPDAL